MVVTIKLITKLHSRESTNIHGIHSAVFNKPTLQAAYTDNTNSISYYSYLILNAFVSHIIIMQGLVIINVSSSSRYRHHQHQKMIAVLIMILYSFQKYRKIHAFFLKRKSLFRLSYIHWILNWKLRVWFGIWWLLVLGWVNVNIG